MTFSKLASRLQNDFGLIDLLSRPSRSNEKLMELLVIKLDHLKVKMYQENGHALPHIHIDYGKQHHAASFSIDPPERIEGQLSRKYDKSVQVWLAHNKEALIALWGVLQTGESPGVLVAELQGDAT